ncbi:MAG: proline--tRNA ligase [Firmicutes bacterium]|nr:proline--tRNA ligase [Bacillota bacterium]
MEKKKLDSIADINTDFPQWYTDVVVKSGLVSYSGVKGCMYIPPYGTALWENMKVNLDARFKKLGVENVTMPLLIPESLFQKEKDHIKGFAPEVAWVTHGGEEKLAERLLIRPTSEVLFCDYFASHIHSYRDLPKKFNQWANIVRWEKNTRPFLRTTEFFWQEGHTLHETKNEAMKMTLAIHKLYCDFAREVLAIPMLAGKKTESEKFAGAVDTFTIEAMMHDGKALQAGTSHFLGNGFSKAFGIKYQSRAGKEQYPFYTSWGASTRLIGGIVMAHGDENGLILPPHVAPIQVIIVPIQTQKEGVLKAAKKFKKSIERVVRTHMDETENSPGWKFAEWEMRGVPIRIEYGPRDIENQTCVVVLRNTREKISVNIADLKKELPKLLQRVHDGMYERALNRLNEMTYDAKNMNEITTLANTKPGFIRAPWCSAEGCEDKLKSEFGITSRCIINDTNETKCAICGEQSKYIVVWARAY